MDAGNGSWYRATGDLDENKPFTWTSGYRIVDLCEFAKQMRCKKCSSLLDLNNTQNETRFGLASVLSVLCYDCRTLNDVCTGKAQRTREGEAMFEINMKTSVNMLLNGIGAQYVIHFLAVLDIPVPMQDDAFMVMPSSPGDVTPLQTPQPPAVESPGGVIQTPILTSPPPTSSSQVCQPVNLSGTTTTGGSLAENSDDLLVQLDDIKHEAMQGLSNTESLTRSSQNEKQQNKPKAEKQQPIVSSVKSVVSASQSGGADLDDTEECSSFDPPAEKEDVLPFFENSTQRKYYRCPLCPRVLPSIRGFQVHVARKHQASQFRAEHHVLGPDAGYTGDKAQLSRMAESRTTRHSTRLVDKKQTRQASAPAARTPPPKRKKKKKTPSEVNKEYMDRLKQDPVRHLKWQERNKKRCQEYRKNADDTTKERWRVESRRRVAECRARAKTAVALLTLVSRPRTKHDEEGKKRQPEVCQQEMSQREKWREAKRKQREHMTLQERNLINEKRRIQRAAKKKEKLAEEKGSLYSSSQTQSEEAASSKNASS